MSYLTLEHHIKPLFDVGMIVLFDSGASHSSMAVSFVNMHKLRIVKEQWNLSIPPRVDLVSTLICRKCPNYLRTSDVIVDRIDLGMKNFAIILGMD